MQPTLLVLAAGIGSRYGGLKQVEPVGPGGEIILEYSIFDAIRSGFGKVVFVIRKEIEEVFESEIAARIAGRLPYQYAYQELDKLPPAFSGSVIEGRAKPWGTGHAVWVAKEQVQGPFAVINADDFYGPKAFSEVGRHLQTPDAGYAMVGFRLDQTLSENGSVSRGVCSVTGDGHLKSVVEYTDVQRLNGKIVAHDPEGVFSGNEAVSMNFWALQPDIFERLESQFVEFLEQRGQELKSEFYLPAAVDRIVASGQRPVQVLRSDDRWFGVTYPQDKQMVAEGIRKVIGAGTYPERLWN